MNIERVKAAQGSDAAAAARRRRNLPPTGPLLDIVQQHGEEAGFLWGQRDRAVRAPHYNLRVLERLDERVEAHVDGLRVAGDAGWEIAQGGIAEPGGFFAAAIVALDSRIAERIQFVLEAASKEPALARAFASALGWLPWKRAEFHARPWLDSPSPALRRAAVAAYALHRRDPGPVLLKAAGDADPGLRARALRAIGELGLMAHLPLAQRATGDADPAVAFAASWTTALLSKDAGPLIAIVTRDRARAAKGIPLAARRGGAGWTKPLAPRLAILAAGHAGDPSSIPWLLEQMKVPVLARAAGEAFSMITGAVIDDDGLEGAAPEDFKPGPTDDPADENVEMDPDENLTWPDADAAASWWNDRKGGLKAGTRHLLGKPIEASWARSFLRDAFQRQRAAAALEWAIAEPGKPLFEVRAPGWRQRKTI